MRWLNTMISKATTSGSKMPRWHDFPWTPTSLEVPPSSSAGQSDRQYFSQTLLIFNSSTHRARFSLLHPKSSPLANVGRCAFIQTGFILLIPRLWTHKWIKQSPVLSSNSTGLEPASQRSGLSTKERLEMGVTPNNGLFSNYHTVVRKNEWLQGKGKTFQEMKSHVATSPTGQSGEVRPSGRDHYCCRNKHKFYFV